MSRRVVATRGQLARVFEQNRLDREVCRPRGTHRPTGVTETKLLGGEPVAMQRCADCGVWTEP